MGVKRFFQCDWKHAYFMNEKGGYVCAPVTSKGKGNHCKSIQTFMHPFHTKSV